MWYLKKNASKLQQKNATYSAAKEPFPLSGKKDGKTYCCNKRDWTNFWTKHIFSLILYTVDHFDVKLPLMLLKKELLIACSNSCLFYRDIKKCKIVYRRIICNHFGTLAWTRPMHYASKTLFNIWNQYKQLFQKSINLTLQNDLLRCVGFYNWLKWNVCYHCRKQKRVIIIGGEKM